MYGDHPHPHKLTAPDDRSVSSDTILLTLSPFTNVTWVFPRGEFHIWKYPGNVFQMVSSRCSGPSETDSAGAGVLRYAAARNTPAQEWAPMMLTHVSFRINNGGLF